VVKINDILDELKALKEEDDMKAQNDVHMRTIVKLLAIEKKALYGTFHQKNKQMEKEILSELVAYKELLNASK
jgi:hypothetical protein